MGTAEAPGEVDLEWPTGAQAAGLRLRGSCSEILKDSRKQRRDLERPAAAGVHREVLEWPHWAACAGVHRSLTPRPVPGSEAQHWYKGWETGP